MAAKNDYKIKVYRSEDEDKNRQLYKSKKAVQHKWVSICSDVNAHGDKSLYEKCLVQAFNLTELVMDNCIEELFQEHNRNGNVERVPRAGEKPWENGTYRFIEQGTVIDFHRLIKAGYGGKTEIIEKMGIPLPEGINEVRRNRNQYAHGTDTYINSVKSELDDFSTILQYMDTLGNLLVVMGKLPGNMVRPSFENMMLQVGGTIGRNDEYAALELVKKEKGKRIFAGRNGKNKKDIWIKEIAPRPDLLEIYRGSKENLMHMVGNGIARTENVILKNSACYIITERIEGVTLYHYLKEHQTDFVMKKDLLYQVKKIVATLLKNPNVSSEFKESDFVVDAGGDLWLTQYEFGEMKLSEEEIIRRFKLLFDIRDNQSEIQLVKRTEKTQKAASVVYETTVIDNPPVGQVYPVNEEQPAEKDLQMREEKTMTPWEAVQVELPLEAKNRSRENDWIKLCLTTVACSIILVVLWVISSLLV